MKRIGIIGGGICGLVAANLLARKGLEVLLFERKKYPLHRVCGEYISGEALPFLELQGLLPDGIEYEKINTFQLSSVSGRNAVLPLTPGGIGISRYFFDHYLVQKAREAGAVVMEESEVTEIKFQDNVFNIQTHQQAFTFNLVVCAFGKRSNLDLALGRAFTKTRSPYVGIKHHIKTNHPKGLIALHNFEGGYCGISNIEGGKTNLCYLVHRNVLKQHKSIESLEATVLMQNPQLKRIFCESEFLFSKPETINEISFATKTATENGMLMAGDAAGMITPLCGNGMALAVHAAKIIAEVAEKFLANKISRQQMELEYTRTWHKTFYWHLAYGRSVQGLFGSTLASTLAVNLALYFKPLARFMVNQSHGKMF